MNIQQPTLLTRLKSYITNISNVFPPPGKPAGTASLQADGDEPRWHFHCNKIVAEY